MPRSLLNLRSTNVLAASASMLSSCRDGTAEPAPPADRDSERLRGDDSVGGIRVGSQVTKYMSPSRSPDAIVSGMEWTAVDEKTDYACIELGININCW